MCARMHAHACVGAAADSVGNPHHPTHPTTQYLMHGEEGEGVEACAIVRRGGRFREGCVREVCSFGGFARRGFVRRVRLLVRRVCSFEGFVRLKGSFVPVMRHPTQRSSPNRMLIAMADPTTCHAERGRSRGRDMVWVSGVGLSDGGRHVTAITHRHRPPPSPNH